MRIAIDLDDVTVAIMDGLLKYHNGKYNTEFLVEHHTSWDLDKIWACTPNEAMRRVYDFYKSEYMDKLLPMPGAIEGIHNLNDKHSLFFVTSRPTFIKEKTTIWLNEHLPNLSIPVYFTNQYSPEREKKEKKSDVCKRLNIELIIEDAPSNISDCIMNNIRVLVYSRPWNTSLIDTELMTRVHTWKDIVSNIS